LDWYVIHTKPRQEERALENLERQGFECYLPTLSIVKIRHGKQCVVVEPMFSRYLFIQLDDSGHGKSWIPIRSTKGVSRLVMFGGEAAKVEETLISALRDRSNTETICTQPLFTSGEPVRLTEGAFANIQAIYHMDDGDKRAMVLIDLLSRPVSVSVPTAQLRKA
jgi:transcriptional antiterminator RfaH